MIGMIDWRLNFKTAYSATGPIAAGPSTRVEIVNPAMTLATISNRFRLLVRANQFKNAAEETSNIKVTSIKFNKCKDLSIQAVSGFFAQMDGVICMMMCKIFPGFDEYT